RGPFRRPVLVDDLGADALDQVVRGQRGAGDPVLLDQRLLQGVQPAGAAQRGQRHLDRGGRLGGDRVGGGARLGAAGGAQPVHDLLRGVRRVAGVDPLPVGVQPGGGRRLGEGGQRLLRGAAGQCGGEAGQPAGGHVVVGQAAADRVAGAGGGGGQRQVGAEFAGGPG